MRRLALLTTVALLAVPALADIHSAQDKFLHGDYASAIKDFAAVKGKDAAKAQLGLGRAYLRTGQYPDAEKAAEKAAKAKDKQLAEDAETLEAEIDRATGKTDDARKLLEQLVAADPKAFRARCQLGLLYRDVGEDQKATDIWNSFYDDYGNGAIDKNNAEQLMYVAIAARNMRTNEGYDDSNSTFQDAVNADPNFIEANVEWGWLFLEKYAAGMAEQSFDEVLKIDPNNPDAHVGMARVIEEQSYDVPTIMDHLDKALAVNPKHAGALEVRAGLEIDNNQYDDAIKTLNSVLAVNDQDLEAHTLLATVYWLRDDSKDYDAEKQKVFTIDPKFSRFYNVVADYGVKEHRYKEAIALEEEAIKVDPNDFIALAEIGNGYLRMGDDTTGLKYLNEAFDGDKYNVRTYNLLNLYDDVINKRYTTFQSPPHFRFRMVTTEKPMLERYVPRTLEVAFKDMVKRYGFTPTTPVTVEMYDDPDNYSVRTVGLPNLGALGVCFGQVITAISPSTGNVNWGMVLWHELGHVFAIQLSNSRVPRWFTEGLSEYETLRARPEWRRENDVDIWMAMEAGQLPSVIELNTKFLRAKDINETVVAYHMSSVTIQFIVETWGFPKIVDALKLYGQGKDTKEVLKSITGLDVPDFDKKFHEYLDKRLAPYKGTFKIRLSDYTDVTALEKAAAATPKDAEAQANLAVGYMVAEDGEKAGTAAQAALTIDPKNKKALYVQAQVAMAGGDTDTAKARLNDLIAAGGDGYDARLQLGLIAIKADDVKEAETQMNKAKTLDPERSEPYSDLADLYFKHNRDDDALKELEKYAYIEQMEYAPVQKLVEKYGERKNWAKVKEFGEMALFINPYDADLHVEVGEGYLNLGQLDDAVYEYQSALLSDPPLKRPALADLGLARAYLAKKDAKKARKALDDALKEEPQNADALALKKQLAGGKVPTGGATSKPSKKSNKSH